MASKQLYISGFIRNVHLGPVVLLECQFVSQNLYFVFGQYLLHITKIIRETASDKYQIEVDKVKIVLYIQTILSIKATQGKQ